MEEGVIEIVGCTPATPGVARGLVCAVCDGDGMLGDPNFGEEVEFCPDCDGRGGTDPAAVDRARQFSAAYKEALTG